MCLPLAALPIIAGGIQAVGSVVGGMQANAQAGYQAKVAKADAKYSAESAHEAELQGQDQSRQLYRHLGQVKGQQQASMAANGIDTSFGSAALLAEDTAQAGKEDAENLYHNTFMRARGYDIEGANYRSEAQAAKSRGKSALVGSLFDAAGSMMSGFQQSSAMKAKLGKTGG
jgi:hypothetical protein